MSEFFETFNNGARHLREEREFKKVNVVQAKRSGRGPQPLDLESGRIVLVRPGEAAPGVSLMVRPAEPRDFPEVARITVRAYLDGGDLRHDDPYVEVLRDVEGRSREAEVWVATEDDRVVGTLTWCPPGSSLREVAGPGDGEFRMLAVDPAAQGGGAGRLLVETAVRRAREDGLTGLVLCSSPWMTVAHRLYRSLGFVRAPGLDWAPCPEVQLLAFRLEL